MIQIYVDIQTVSKTFSFFPNLIVDCYLILIVIVTAYFPIRLKMSPLKLTFIIIISLLSFCFFFVLWFHFNVFLMDIYLRMSCVVRKDISGLLNCNLFYVDSLFGLRASRSTSGKTNRCFYKFPLLHRPSATFLIVVLVRIYPDSIITVNKYNELIIINEPCLFRCCSFAMQTFGVMGVLSLISNIFCAFSVVI